MSAVGRIAVTALVFVMQPVFAATYHVNNVAGDDTNDGTTPTGAFASLNRGVKELRPGDCLILAATGTAYRENLPIGRRSGLPGKPIVIEGNGAVLTGLRPVPVDAWETGDDGVLFYPFPRVGANRPYLVSAGQAVARAKQVGDVTPGTHLWTKKGAYFLPEEGRTIADYQM